MDTGLHPLLVAGSREPAISQHLRDLGWIVLRNDPPPSVTLAPVETDLVAARVDTGVLLLELGPHRTERAVEHLRARLAAIGFDDAAGYLPIVHLVVGRDDAWRLTSILDHAFALEPAITREDAWMSQVGAALAAGDPPPPPPLPIATRGWHMDGVRALVAFWAVLLSVGSLAAGVLQVLGPPSAPARAEIAEAVPGPVAPAGPGPVSPAWSEPAPRAASAAPAQSQAAQSQAAQAQRPPSPPAPPASQGRREPPPTPQPVQASRDPLPATAGGARGRIADPPSTEGGDGSSGDAPPARTAPRRAPPPEIAEAVPPESKRGGNPARADLPVQPRIVVHHAPGDLGTAAVVVGLASRTGGRTETRSVPATPSSPGVRYFSPGDRGVAERVAAQLGPAWRVHDFSSYTPRPSRGTIEVWIPNRDG